MANDGNKVVRSLEAEVTCPLCLDVFTDPKRLPCEHVYCRECLQGVAQRTQRRGHVSCPECRADTVIPGNNVANFPTPRQLNRLVEMYLNSTQAIPNKTSQAGSSDQEATCRLHPSEPLSLYCETCKSLTCRDCALVTCAKQHHNYGFAEEMAKKHKQFLTDELECIEKLHQEMCLAVSDISAAENKLQAEKRAKLEDIRLTFDSYHQFLEQERERLTEVVEKACEDQESAYFAKKSEVSKVVQDLKSVTETIKKAFIKEPASVFMTTVGKRRQSIRNMKEYSRSISLHPKVVPMVNTKLTSLAKLEEVFRTEHAEDSSQDNDVLSETANIERTDNSSEDDDVLSDTNENLDDANKIEHTDDSSQDDDDVLSNMANINFGARNDDTDGTISSLFDFIVEKPNWPMRDNSDASDSSQSEDGIGVQTTRKQARERPTEFIKEDMSPPTQRRGFFSNLFADVLQQKDAATPRGGLLGFLQHTLNFPENLSVQLESSSDLCNINAFESVEVTVLHTSDSRRRIYLTAHLECSYHDSTQIIDVKCVSAEKSLLSFSSQHRGHHKLHIKHQDQHVRGSPFPVFVFLHPLQIRKCRRITQVDNFGGIKHYNGELFISTNSGIAVYTSVLTSFRRKIRVAGLANEVIVDGSHIYASDVLQHRILKMDMNGNILKSTGSQGFDLGEFSYPNGIRLSKDDEIFVCDTRNHRIQVFNKNLNLIRVIGRRGTAKGCFYSPDDLDFDEEGNIYVAEQENHRIQVLTSQGTHIRYIGASGELRSPISPAVHHNKVYVTDVILARVCVFETSGKFITSIGENVLLKPECLAIDDNGFIHVTDARSRVVTF